MRFGHCKSRDLDGHKTLKDWLLAQVAIAELTAPDGEELVFILPLTGTRFTLRDRTSIPAFAKKVKSTKNNLGFGVIATKHALAGAG
jgi:hypothetical protein